MNTTFQNSAQVVSIGIFFSLIIVGLSSTLPHSLYHGLVANGVSVSAATKASHLPPVSTLFAAFLGYNPVQHLIGSSALSHLSLPQQAIVNGHSFFPQLITGPFRSGLHAAFDFAIGASLVAAAASWTRGGRYVYVEPPAPDTTDAPQAADEPVGTNGDRPPAAVTDTVSLTTRGAPP
jgi:hypothetical protein